MDAHELKQRTEDDFIVEGQQQRNLPNRGQKSLRDFTLLGSAKKKGVLEADSDGALGKKTITFWGSTALNVNNIMGPAMVALPYLNQSSGWFTCTLMLIICTTLSAFASTMICDAMQRIPGNHNFTGRDAITGKRYEFCDVIKHYYGNTAAMVGQGFFNVSLQASNIAAMVICAQILDDFFVFVCKWSIAFQYAGHGAGTFHTVSAGLADQSADYLFGSPYVVSLGFVIAMVICIPFGFLNLDEVSQRLES
jgi:amino acid permease